MAKNNLFIYDGECPFCNHFAHLLELKSSFPSLQIIDGRKNLALLTELYKKGYDLNDGAILINDGKIMNGAEAVSWICSEIKEPSHSLLELIRIIFISKKRTQMLFPFLIWARRIVLTIRGKVLQPVNINNQYY